MLYVLGSDVAPCQNKLTCTTWCDAQICRRRRNLKASTDYRQIRDKKKKHRISQSSVVCQRQCLMQSLRHISSQGARETMQNYAWDRHMQWAGTQEPPQACLFMHLLNGRFIPFLRSPIDQVQRWGAHRRSLLLSRFQIILSRPAAPCSRPTTSMSTLGGISLAMTVVQSTAFGHAAATPG